MANMKDRLPPEAVMKEMARIAVEIATESLAKLAEKASENIASGQMRDVGGCAALKAFASAIRATNQKQFPQSDHKA